MVFSSTVFLFTFLPLVLACYYLIPRAVRNGLLVVASLAFYGWGEPKYILIMVVSVLFNYAGGLAIGGKINKHKPAKLMLALVVIGNLLILGLFKYGDFAIENVNSILGASIGLLNLALPIGISFYTFQAMSYVIDVYREKAKPQKNLIDFAAYITLFPQLIAGPIVRYVTIEEQLQNRRCTWEMTGDGVRRFIVGLGKKVLLANQAGLIWTEISSMNSGDIPALTAWLGAIAFTFQIYFDFSGYSDMAIGLGRILGFRFEENFNYPYIAKSITDFWRRWHISLSTWFKEYVYIPLGGNRKGIARQAVNIMLVWALTGLWHGANWNFVWWGVYFGAILIVEKLFLLDVLSKLPTWVCHIYSLLLIVFSWVIFAVTEPGQLGEFLGALFGADGFADDRSWYFARTFALMMFIMTIGSTPLPSKWGQAILAKLEEKPVVYLVIKNGFYLAVLVMATAFLVSDTYNPFLYFRF